jgi:hypothetical protein
MKQVRSDKPKVARRVKPATNRITTPDLTDAEREKIQWYRAQLREDGTILSESAAFVHAAMQTIDQRKAAQQGGSAQ